MNRKLALKLGLLLVPVYLFVFFGRRVPLPNTPYVLVIQPGVSAQSVDLVMTGLEGADQFLVAMMGRTVIEKTEVRVSNFTPCSPLTPLPQFAATAEVVGNRLCINTRSGVWQQALNQNPAIALSVIAHEHYHVLQHQLGCLRAWNKEYEWLIEGGAAYLGWETVITSGELDREWVDTLLTKMRTSDDPGPLAAYERTIGGDASYSLAYQAVQQLITKTGSLVSLNDFCTRVGHGKPWREAFADTFGITVEEFYTDFEASRGTVQPQ